MNNEKITVRQTETGKTMEVVLYSRRAEVIEVVIGEGAHSRILHIRRHADNRNYALKVVPINEPEDRKFLEQAQHEFRVGQMLDHPCLLKVYTLEVSKDWFFRPRKVHLLLEFVNGKTLDTCPPLPLVMLVQVFEKVASALVHMHRRNVYHGDLKPNNLLLSHSGDVKVIDFGLAWIKGEPKDRVQGTLEYMAPETVKSRVINERTDIYNLGATMYRLTTLKLPPSSLPGTESLRLNAKAHVAVLTPVQELNKAAPKALCDLIHKCLNFDPERRPERMGEVLEELTRIANEQGTPLSAFE